MTSPTNSQYDPRAVLGCPTNYRVQITTKGGQRVIAELDTVTEAKWERQIHEPSTATCLIVKSSVSPSCCLTLGRLRPWAHEMAFWRDSRLVWCGPVTRVIEHAETFEINGRDLMSWMRKVTNSKPFKWGLTPSEAGTPDGTVVDASDIAKDLMNDGLAQHDPNMSPYVIYFSSGLMMRRKIDGPQEVTILGEIEAMTDLGLTYTTVGRNIIFASIDNPVFGTVATLHADDILGDTQIIWDGEEWITESTVFGEGVKGHAGGIDPVYGLLSEAQKFNGLIRTIDCENQAQRRVTEHRAGEPILYLPDDARLSPTAPVTIDQLVCGTSITVAISDYCVPMTQTLRLLRMTVSWNVATGENVGVSLAKSVRHSVRLSSADQALARVIREQRRRMDTLQRSIVVQVAGQYRLTAENNTLVVTDGATGIKKIIYP